MNKRLTKRIETAYNQFINVHVCSKNEGENWMTSVQRRLEIMKILEQRKSITKKELEKLLYLSTSTLRRDLIKLENEGKVLLSHGEVILSSPNNIEYSFRTRKRENMDTKVMIAEIAANYLGDNQSIFLDSSTTALCLLPHMRAFSNLRVITNGLEAAMGLSAMENVTLYFAGGYISHNTNSALGNFTSDFLSNFRADLAIFSCRGLDRFGTYEANHEQAMMKKRMMENANSNILLVDHTKFNTSHYFKLSSFQFIDAIVTDLAPSEIFLEAVESQCEILWPEYSR